MTDVKTTALLDALEDMHNTVRRKPVETFPEFRVRARPMLEKYEHQLRAAGTMDKTTFVSAFSWFFHLSVPEAWLEICHPVDDHKRLRLRTVALPMGHRGVEVGALHRPEGPFHTPEQAAEVVWRFLQGENPPESTGWR